MSLENPKPVPQEAIKPVERKDIVPQNTEAANEVPEAAAAPENTYTKGTETRIARQTKDGERFFRAEVVGELGDARIVRYEDASGESVEQLVSIDQMQRSEVRDRVYNDVLDYVDAAEKAYGLTPEASEDVLHSLSVLAETLTLDKNPNLASIQDELKGLAKEMAESKSEVAHLKAWEAVREHIDDRKEAVTEALKRNFELEDVLDLADALGQDLQDVADAVLAQDQPKTVEAVARTVEDTTEAIAQIKEEDLGVSTAESLAASVKQLEALLPILTTAALALQGVDRNAANALRGNVEQMRPRLPSVRAEVQPQMSGEEWVNFVAGKVKSFLFGGETAKAPEAQEKKNANPRSSEVYNALKSNYEAKSSPADAKAYREQVKKAAESGNEYAVAMLEDIESNKVASIADLREGMQKLQQEIDKRLGTEANAESADSAEETKEAPEVEPQEQPSANEAPAEPAEGTEPAEPAEEVEPQEQPGANEAPAQEVDTPKKEAPKTATASETYIEKAASSDILEGRTHATAFVELQAKAGELAKQYPEGLAGDTEFQEFLNLNYEDYNDQLWILQDKDNAFQRAYPMSAYNKAKRKLAKMDALISRANQMINDAVASSPGAAEDANINPNVQNKYLR